jgi:alpha-methylacyl-CoA racemase
MSKAASSLPLSGVRIIELGGIGPGPFCGMMLADNGAEVIRIDRPGGVKAGVPVDAGRDVMLRSRRNLSLNLKSPGGVEIIRRLVERADGFIEGFRPGVTERLGLGPDDLMSINSGLVYGRMTGWGQDGPYSVLPGHDINYIAVSGVLDAIGRAGEAPVPPLNLLGDYGGGGLMLAFGMISAILAVRSGASGRVVDCAMAEGASALMAGIWTLRNQGKWTGGRGGNLLDGGAPFYDTYRASDGRYLCLGAIEEKFFARLVQLIGMVDDPAFRDQYDESCWPAMKSRLSAVFASKPLEYWIGLLEQEDVCFAPVMSMDEAASHPHNKARGSFLTVDGMVQPVPVPRYCGTPVAQPRMWQENSDLASLLDECGFDDLEIGRFKAEGAFR